MDIKLYSKDEVDTVKHIDNRDCPLYFGVYIEQKYVSQLFEDPIYFSGGKHNRKPYDWKCKNGFKIKHVASCLRIDAIHPPYWGYSIRNNKIPDYFILSAWDDRDSLMPEHIWMIQRDTILKSQLSQSKPVPFWNRVSFSVYDSVKNLRKMQNYEIIDKLDQLKLICNRKI